MPLMENQLRYQDCVYWAFDSYDGNGEPKVTTPIDIKVRWEQVKNESVADDGSTIAIDGTMFVDRDIAVDSILRLGTVVTLPSPVTGELMIVESFDKIPDVKGRNYQRTAMVKRWRNTLPTVAS